MKTFISILIAFLLSSFIYSESSNFIEDNYEEFTLENGLQLYVLEDFSSAPVRIEYTVHAGISSSSQNNTGFFSLYSRLFKYNFSEIRLNEMTAECNADSSRYIITVSPAKIKDSLEELSQHAFSPVFSDSAIEKELNIFKSETMQYAYTPAAFINSSIDARVFSAAPWKHDSGIYPSLFSKTTPAQARTVLSGISENWYTPQNSALFISGSIKKETALKLVQETFGKFPKAVKSETQGKITAGGKIRKFVIYDSQFSEDLTQIVMQYTSLNMNQCDIAATAFNSNLSNIKQKLLSDSRLSIRDAEYINVAAAHKNGTSRLIFQSLLEKNKITPLEQANSFIENIYDSAKITTDNEFNSAKKYIEKNFTTVTSNSTILMDYLSQYWAIDKLIENKNQTLIKKLLSRPSDIEEENIEDLKKTLSAEVPFIFVLVNTKTYNKFFKNSDFQVITQKNGSWFTQKLKDAAILNIKTTSEQENNSDYNSTEFLEQFISDSKKSISSITLKNGIKVCFKKNKNSSNAAILVKLSGGKLADSGNPGFETVMINALTANIKKELYDYSQKEILDGYPIIESETENSCSYITIECHSADVPVCINSIGKTLFFSEIKPAEADSYVYSVQTQKRLYNGNPVNQMLFRGIKYLFESSVYRDIFDSENDILQNTNYNDLLAAYPNFLDASRYSIVITGNFDYDSAVSSLENSIEMLIPQNINYLSQYNNEMPDFPSKTKRISLKIRHLFYTDISADKAGPMPAILVPTKEFLDPVQYWFKTPEYNSKDAVIFNSLLLRLQEKLSEQGKETKILFPSREIPAAAITFLNVKRTNEIDRIYAMTVFEFLKLIKSKDINSFKESEEIKNAWILNTLTSSQTNKGTAKLIASGTYPEEYLDNYKFILNCTDEDFAKTAEKFLKAEAPLKIYSADSKR